MKWLPPEIEEGENILWQDNTWIITSYHWSALYSSSTTLIIYKRGFARFQQYRKLAGKSHEFEKLDTKFIVPKFIKKKLDYFLIMRRLLR